MFTIYHINLSFIAIICSLLFVTSPATTKVEPLDKKIQDGSPKTSPSRSQSSGLTRKPTYFLSVYASAMASDWLQGPYLYPLYTQVHALSSPSISLLFTIGFLSAAVAAPFVGALTDSRGRKKACIVYCIACSLSCILTALPGATSAAGEPVEKVEGRVNTQLVAGRVCGGIATSLLFTAFESWLVSDFKASGLSEELPGVMTNMGTVNSLAAIVSGVGSEALVSFMDGDVRVPFVAAVVCTIVAATVIWGSWSENYGSSGTEATTKPKHDKTSLPDNGAWRLILTSPDLRFITLASTAFEGSIYLFAVFWAPTLQATSEDVVPFGTVFAALMASCLLASLAFGRFVSPRSSVTFKPSSGAPPADVLRKYALTLLVILFVSAIALFLIAFTSSTTAVFWLCSVFEMAVGVWFPCAGTLKGTLIKDGMRARVYSAMTIPLNIFVVGALILAKEAGGDVGGPRWVFGGCGILLAMVGALGATRIRTLATGS